MNQEQLEALLNYTAQQQGITPELARQNWESNFGPAISVDPLDMGSGQGALGELSGEPQQADLTSDPVAEEAEKNMAYLRSETGGQKLSDAFGLSGSNLEKLYMTDPETGRQFVYGDGWEGLSPEYYGLDPTDLQMTTAMTKREGDWVRHDYEGEDPLYFGGVVDPTTREKWATDSARDDKSDNDIWYTDPQGVQRVDVSGTGQSIPVGSTNITRDPTSYTSPVLEKTYEGYQAVGTSAPDELSKIPESGTLLEAFTPQSKGGRPYDLGKIFGLDEGKLVFSNPPSDRFNLEPFFNQTESQGTDNFLRSQQRDVLQMIKDGNFFTALAGKPPGSSILSPNIPGQFATDPLQLYDSYYDVKLGQEGLNEVLSQLQGLDDPKSGIDSGYQVDPFDTEQVASITGDPEVDPNVDPDTTTPAATTPYKVNAYKGGLGPYARNWIFQRYGYDTEKIDWDLTYDPVQELYFFPNGEAVDPKLLEGVKFTKLDEDGEPITEEGEDATNE